MRSLGKWGPHHHGGQPTNSWAPFTLAIACGVYFWANHLLYLRVGWSRSATLNHEGLCVGGVRRVVATITLDNSLNSVPSQESDMGPPPNGIQVSGTHSRCYGVTLIPPSGLKSSFLQLLGVLADSDCQLGPSPGIAFSPHSHLTQSCHLPASWGHCIQLWMWGCKYTFFLPPDRTTQKGHPSSRGPYRTGQELC